MTKMGSVADLVKSVTTLSVAVLIGGCASTPPTKIGGDSLERSKSRSGATRVYWPLVVWRVIGGGLLLIGVLGAEYALWNASPGIQAFFS